MFKTTTTNCSVSVIDMIMGSGTTSRFRWLPPYMKLVSTQGYSAADVSKAFYRWGCKFAFMEGNDHYNISIDGPEEFLIQRCGYWID